MESEQTKIKLNINRLVIGLYIDLELSWTQHPFLFSRFKIKTTKEISIIKSLGLKEVTVFLEHSSPDATLPDQELENTESAEKAKDALWKMKDTRIEQAESYRSHRNKAAAHYRETTKRVRNFTNALKNSPANAVRDAKEIIEDIASAFEQESNVMMNLVNLSDSSFSLYNHSLNVTVLSLALGRSEGLKGDDLRQLGLGAILHDVGKVAVPSNILLKKSKLTPSELAILNSHPLLGSQLAQRVQILPKAAVSVIEQHHEMMDGSGYPNQLKTPDISLAARITAIANLYDNLCNPKDVTKALTPKAALAILYIKYNDRLDSALVGRFIKTMGVYPPGTVVQLSDDSIALVVAVAADALLKPTILLYNPDIPPKDAIMIDLQQYEDLSITTVLKPGTYPARICTYLGIKDRMGFFHEERLKP
jgi:HD-GYP domain-containing protein (c-di-GMP phosphodiesterase class II)